MPKNNYKKIIIPGLFMLLALFTFFVNSGLTQLVGSAFAIIPMISFIINIKKNGPINYVLLLSLIPLLFVLYMTLLLLTGRTYWH